MQIGIYYEQPIKGISTEDLIDMLVIRWEDGRESKFRLNEYRQLMCDPATGVDFEGNIDKLVYEIQSKLESDLGFYYVDEFGKAFKAELINIDSTPYITVKGVYGESDESLEGMPVESGIDTKEKFFKIKKSKFLLVIMGSTTVLFLCVFFLITIFIKPSQIVDETIGEVRDSVDKEKSIDVDELANDLPYVESQDDVEITVGGQDESELADIVEKVSEEISANIVIYNYGTININP